MADKDELVVGIKFDLESAVETGAKEWKDTYAKLFEKALAKRPVKVKLTFDPKDLDSVKRRLETLKLQPLTPETKAAIKEFARELNVLAKALENVQKYAKPGKAAIEAEKAATATAKRKKAEEEAAAAIIKKKKAEEDAAAAAARARKAELALAEARRKAIERAGRSAESTRNLTREYRTQNGYLQRLLKRLTVYASIGYIGGFLTKVREVTAQFELQRVSLGAIIQDQTRANQLFSEIKAFALKSPVSILDLTKYTKQLAAYKIGVDELFETTKKLTDVSVGLGVSMDRVVLAYGQTRATGHLRASEIRQFTEMGVPIVEELAAKLSKMNGELVTAAQVMDMVSKRAISFEMVKEVFDDMTSAGGIFYNMQEKQGNTLFGLWAKLGDAASVMYDQIGNTDWVNSGMKMAIEGLTELMRNFKAAIPSLVAGLTAGGVLNMFINAYIANLAKLKAAQKNVEIAVRSRERAERMLAAAKREGNAVDILSAEIALENAQAQELEAKKLTRMGSVVSNVTAKFKNFALSIAKFLGIGIVITLVTTLIYKLLEAWTNADKLKNALAEIDAKSAQSISAAVLNFESLANAAVGAADGTRKQREALEELQRTYGRIIPVQDLTIEKLRAMTDGYRSLTNAIRENMAQQTLTEKINTIQEEYGKSIEKNRRALQKWLTKSVIVDGKNIGEEQARRIISNIEEGISKGFKSSRAIREAFSLESIALTSKNIKNLGNRDRAVGAFVQSLRKLYKEIRAVQNEMKPALGIMGQYTDEWNATLEGMKNFRTQTAKQGTYQFDRQKMNSDILHLKQFVSYLFNAEGIVFEEGFASIKDTIQEGDELSVIFWDKVNEAAKKGSAQLKGALQTAQSAYLDIIPKDDVISMVNFKVHQFATESAASMSYMRRFILKDGADIEQALKDATSELDNLNNKMAQWTQLNANASESDSFMRKSAQEMQQLANEIQGVTLLVEFLKTLIVDAKKGRASQSDPRLGILQEMVSTLTNINKKYDEMRKKEGDARALAEMERIYADTFANMAELSTKYKFGLPNFNVPTNANELKKYLGAVRNAMSALPKSDKAVLALDVQINDIDTAERQKQLEAQLKSLADKVSQTKAAREFYDKILGQTGDVDLAANVTMSIYGEAGEDLQNNLAEYLTQMVGQLGLYIPMNVMTEKDDINFLALRKWADENKEALGETYKDVVKIAENGQKDLAKTYEGYLKDIAKAKTYADKRVELARTTAEKIKKINADIAAGNIPQEEGREIIFGLQAKELQDLAKLEYEAFKDTPLYVQMFENLDYASSSALERMKEKLISMRDMWGESLDPTQIKEMQSRLEEINSKLRDRNPWKQLREDFIAYRDTMQGFTIMGAQSRVSEAATRYDKAVQKTGSADSAEARAAKKTLDIETRRLEIVQQLTNKKGKQLKGQKAINKAVEIAAANEAKAKVELEKALADEAAAQTDSGKEAAHVQVEAKREELNLAQAVSALLQKDVTTSKGLKESFASAASNALQGLKAMGDIAKGIADVTEALGGDSEDVAFWNTIGDSIGQMVEGLQGVLDAVMSLDIMGLITSIIKLIPNMIVGFSNIFSAGKIRAANKEIRRQQELLEQLEYTYSRLEKLTDKVFGSEFIANFNQQLRILEARQEAYEKQAEAERSKGKKADKDKIKEYEDSARDVADTIADMYGTISQKMLGTDLASAAKDFASAWLEAYKSFSSTADAMRNKFQEMIENMVVESVLARVMQQALQPTFDMIDKMSASDFQDPKFWQKVANEAMTAAANADAGASTVMKFLEQAGISIRDLGSDMTGISRDIASASEESINGLAAGINTQNFYISQILAEVRLIREGNGGGTQSPQWVNVLELQNQHLSHLPQIAANTAATVERCERAAMACEAVATQLGRVVQTKGGKFVVNTTIV